jgi:hypothetical protein
VSGTDLLDRFVRIPRSFDFDGTAGFGEKAARNNVILSIVLN